MFMFFCGVYGFLFVFLVYVIFYLGIMIFSWKKWKKVFFEICGEVVCDGVGRGKVEVYLF